MSHKQKKLDFRIGIKEIEKQMINNILEYLKNGNFPNNNPKSFIDAYTIVNTLSDQVDKNNPELLAYHNQTIQNYIFDCKRELESEKNADLIERFLFYSDHINILIYWMNRIFSYLDRHYTKSKNMKKLAVHARDLYKSEFF